MSDSRDFPGNLPLLPMGWGATNLDFDGAEDFWQEAKRITADASLGENLDLAMQGESSPRIWLFLHEVGQGALSAAAALEIARELGSRDQAVLILDGDDQASNLTRWAGRHEKEGWIDLVRYGASVLTAGVALPFTGRRGYILGVGSFTPTDVEVQESEDLINRLKRQADDLLIVAPADELGHLWSRLADIRLLCWDRAQTPAHNIDQICARFEEAEDPLTGLIGFGLPEEEGRGFPSGADASVDEPEVEEAMSFASDEEMDPGNEDPEDLVEDPPASEGLTQEEDDEEVAASSGSSRVFWGAAAVILALLVVVSIFYIKVVRVDETTPLERPVVAANPDDPLNSEGEIQPGEIATGSMDTALAQSVNQPEEADATPEDAAMGGPTGADKIEDVSEATADPVAVAANEAAVEEAPGPEFSMDPYLQEVGTDGWALHLYSFPDSVAAASEANRLKRRGFQTALRPFQIKDKGRWYRVYVGSFMSRQEALEAKDPLLAKLKEDWARVTQF